MSRFDQAWKSKAACTRPDVTVDFFSTKADDKYAAKNVCHTQCDVRAQCLRYALETGQLDGIWGGRDQGELRRALSVSHDGKELRRLRFPHCPFCSARPSHLSTRTVELGNHGRWRTAREIVCDVCGFTWRSRTSANAVDAYHAARQAKTERTARLREIQRTRKRKTTVKASTRKET